MRKPGWRSGVLTFANHPSAFLRPGARSRRCSARRRSALTLFAEAGFEECFFVPFDDAIATLSPAGVSRHPGRRVWACAPSSSDRRFASATNAPATSRFMREYLRAPRTSGSSPWKTRPTAASDLEHAHPRD